ncbi:copper resistance protein CopC [Pseudonocardia alaniniphila]|uniref:Copper resistance protein CopC/CopD n=1 Tax=Pseudonocardia alaniniphila TaxID=75291 RepID=A0ABS9TSF2_9PSEU|nr:copper resistance protein CopC [Pseudonocardia alaniniphila]MCH6171483.1 copper resistance protein CopC/CopD [Pseudonocardia alaniniphila]
MGSRLRTLALATLLSVVALVGLAGPASAHAVLDGSSPQDGARVDSEPSEVSLTFDEAVQPIPASDEVISSTGERVDTGQLRQSADGTTIMLPLRPGLPAGTYSATWRVVSADTHIVGGSITFGIGVDPSAAPAPPPDRTRSLDVTTDVAQGLLYLGIVLLIGVGAAAAWLWPWVITARRTRLTLWCGWLLMVVGTLVAFVLQGARAEDGSWPAVLRLAGAGETLGSAFGQELIARLALLLLVIPLLTSASLARLRRLGHAVTGAVAALALLVTVALTGHESVGPDVPLALIAAILHLAAMAIWLGGLAVLVTVVVPFARRGGHELHSAVIKRWSYIAYSCVACLVVTGEFQASRQVEPVQALWSTGYGAVLLIKLGVIAAMLVAAVLAQRRVLATAANGTGDERFAGGDVLTVLRRSVRIEAALAVVVLAVTAVLVSQPPASTTYGPPVDVDAPLGADVVHVHVDDTRRGRQDLELDVTDAAGRPVPVQAITANLSTASVAALGVRLVNDPGDTSRWHSTNTVVPLPGIWTLTLDVTVDPTQAYATAARYRVW